MAGGRPCKIEEKIEIDIYNAKMSGVKVEELAVKYNVSASTIMRIIRKYKKSSK